MAEFARLSYCQNYLCDITLLHANVQCLYKGQSINSDNAAISQKILLESKVFVTQNVDKGATYTCLIYDVFITTGYDAMRICIQNCECSWPRKSPF